MISMSNELVYLKSMYDEFTRVAVEDTCPYGISIGEGDVIVLASSRLDVPNSRFTTEAQFLTLFQDIITT